MSFIDEKDFTPGEWKTMRDIVEAHRDVTRWSNAKLNLFLDKITDELERRRMEILAIEDSTGGGLKKPFGRSGGLKTPDPEAIRVWKEQEDEYRRMMREKYGKN